MISKSYFSGRNLSYNTLRVHAFLTKWTSSQTVQILKRFVLNVFLKFPNVSLPTFCSLTAYMRNMAFSSLDSFLFGQRNYKVTGGFSAVNRKQEKYQYFFFLGGGVVCFLKLSPCFLKSWSGKADALIRTKQVWDCWLFINQKLPSKPRVSCSVFHFKNWAVLLRLQGADTGLWILHF